jgi:hypothetical protein
MMTRSRLYATLLWLGSSILAFRALSMLYHGSHKILVPSVASTIYIELVFDVLCWVSSFRWILTNKMGSTLRLAAACTVIHAFRVAIFTLGRFYHDFDVRSDYRDSHGDRWKWWHVYFASILSAVSLVILAVLVVNQKKYVVKPDWEWLRTKHMSRKGFCFLDFFSSRTSWLLLSDT